MSQAYVPLTPHSLHVCLDLPVAAGLSLFSLLVLFASSRRPRPWRGQGGSAFLTPAALDGEAEETLLASGAGPALDARAAGALPSLGVALVLLGAQRVALAAVTGEGHGPK